VSLVKRFGGHTRASCSNTVEARPRDGPVLEGPPTIALGLGAAFVLRFRPRALLSGTRPSFMRLTAGRPEQMAGFRRGG